MILSRIQNTKTFTFFKNFLEKEEFLPIVMICFLLESSFSVLLSGSSVSMQSSFSCFQNMLPFRNQYWLISFSERSEKSPHSSKSWDRILIEKSHSIISSVSILRLWSKNFEHSMTYSDSMPRSRMTSSFSWNFLCIRSLFRRTSTLSIYETLSSSMSVLCDLILRVSIGQYRTGISLWRSRIWRVLDFSSHDPQWWEWDRSR